MACSEWVRYGQSMGGGAPTNMSESAGTPIEPCQLPHQESRLGQTTGDVEKRFYITTVYGFTMVYQCLSYHHSTRGSGQASWVLPVRNACIPQVNLFDNHTQPLMKVGPRLTGRRVSSVTRGHPASMVVSKVSCLSNSSLKTVSVACPLILCCKTISS